MKATKEFEEFLKSDYDNIDMILLNNKTDRNGLIEKIKTENEDLCFLRYMSQPLDANNFNELKSYILGLANKKTGEVLYLINNEEQYPFIVDDVKDYTKEMNDIHKDMNDKCVELLKPLNKRILGKKEEEHINLNTIKITNKEPIYNLGRLNINPKIIYDYFTNNKEELNKELIYILNDEILRHYEYLVRQNKAVENLVEKIKKEKFGNKKIDLICLIQDPKYKSLTITYEEPDGIMSQRKINLGSDSIRLKIQNNILQKDGYEDITIATIETVNHSSKVLLNSEDYEKPNEFEKNLNFAKANLIEYVDKKYFNDEEFLMNLVTIDDKFVNYLPDDLKYNKKFLFELEDLIINKTKSSDAGKTCLQRFYRILDDKMLSDKEFLITFLEKLPKISSDVLGCATPFASGTFMKNFKDKGWCNDRDFVFLLINQTVLDMNFCSELPKEIINTPKFCENIKNKVYKYSTISQITNPDLLKIVFSDNEICRYFVSLNDDIYKDTDFIKDIILNARKEISFDERFIKMYKYHDEISNLILSKMTDMYFAEKYVNIMNPEKDVDKTLIYVEQNPIFLNFVPNKEEILNDELVDVDDVVIDVISENISKSGMRIRESGLWIKAPNFDLAFYNSFDDHQKLSLLNKDFVAVNNINSKSNITNVVKIIKAKYPEFKNLSNSALIENVKNTILQNKEKDIEL